PSLVTSSGPSPVRGFIAAMLVPLPRIQLTVVKTDTASPLSRTFRMWVATTGGGRGVRAVPRGARVSRLDAWLSSFPSVVGIVVLVVLPDATDTGTCLKDANRGTPAQSGECGKSDVRQRSVHGHRGCRHHHPEPPGSDELPGRGDESGPARHGCRGGRGRGRPRDRPHRNRPRVLRRPGPQGARGGARVRRRPRRHGR